ncbi:MAG: DUF2306 domain-containing protein [Acidobacteriaceae bacterium]|nr:DUF2306 domain-containing protein [Acidobacteriaceae bacterium]
MRASSPQTPRHPLWLLIGFWFCVVISIAVVVRRLIELIRGPQSGTTPLVQINDTFSSHAALTSAHIIPAAIFVVLATVVLLRRGPVKIWEQLFFPFGAVTGATAYAMSVYSIGGWIERSAVLVFDTWFLFCLSRAYVLYRQGDQEPKRAWMIRAVGVLLGIATTRPVMGVFFATSMLTGLQPKQFFGVAFWIGFAINTLTVELWLRSKRRALLHRNATRRTSAPYQTPVAR